MSQVTTPPVEGSIEVRAGKLFDEEWRHNAARTDRLFAGLLAFEWLSGIALAMVISPLTWSGVSSRVHPHVWAALLLGTAITAYPIYLALTRPARPLTRHVIAAAQMLMGGLLIQFTGGRIETHFFIFGSLAFLAFYRDWRVLITASAITAADHLTRGVLWPQSVYGVLTATI